MDAIDLTTIGTELADCGYTAALVDNNFPVPGEARRVLVGFSHRPFDARSACIVAGEESGDPIRLVKACRQIGAPIALVVHQANLQWWQQQPTEPRLIATFDSTQVGPFFRSNQGRLSPESIYRAKTRSRFETEYQLNFVDAGLMPIVESEIGRSLGKLTERLIVGMRTATESIGTDGNGKLLFKAAFWLLAAKILHDKGVDGFAVIDLTDVSIVFDAVSAHYGAPAPHLSLDFPIPIAALRDAAAIVSRFSNLAHVTTESLAYLYENTLISKKRVTNLNPQYADIPCRLHSVAPCSVD